MPNIHENPDVPAHMIAQIIGHLMPTILETLANVIDNAARANDPNKALALIVQESLGKIGKQLVNLPYGKIGKQLVNLPYGKEEVDSIAGAMIVSGLITMLSTRVSLDVIKSPVTDPSTIPIRPANNNPSRN